MEELKTARAQAKFVRIAPRKVQIICDMIRGKDAVLAQALMEHTPKAGCEHVIKVLKSAVANAENNYEMDPEKLYVQSCFVDAGHPQEGTAEGPRPHVPHKQAHEPHHRGRG